MDKKGYGSILSSGAQYFLLLSFRELLIILDKKHINSEKTSVSIKLVQILSFYDSTSSKETSWSVYQTNVTRTNPFTSSTALPATREVSRNCSCPGPLRAGPPTLHTKNFAETTTKKF